MAPVALASIEYYHTRGPLPPEDGHAVTRGAGLGVMKGLEGPPRARARVARKGTRQQVTPAAHPLKTTAGGLLLVLPPNQSSATASQAGARVSVAGCTSCRYLSIVARAKAMLARKAQNGAPSAQRLDDEAQSLRRPCDLA